MFKSLTMSSLIYIQDINIRREEIKYKEYEVESKALITSKKYNKRIVSTSTIKKKIYYYIFKFCNHTNYNGHKSLG